LEGGEKRKDLLRTATPEQGGTFRNGAPKPVTFAVGKEFFEKESSGLGVKATP